MKRKKPALQEPRRAISWNTGTRSHKNKKRVHDIPRKSKHKKTDCYVM